VVETRGVGQARRRAYWGVAPASVAAALLLSPALFAGFFGDDFKLWHVARQMIEAPSTLFIGSGNFYRPANSWLFAVHHLLFGAEPLGYHVGTFLMHLGCGALLGLLAGRFVASPWAVFAVSAAWMCSPFAFEPVQFVNVAYNDLTVLLVWLALAVTWPGPGQGWSRGRAAVHVALVAFSAMCKESWVILPGLVLCFELGLARAPWRRAWRTTMLAAAPALAYVLVYPFVFPGRESYYELGTWGAARVPHLWACFSMLTELQPYKPVWGAAEWIGLALLAGFTALGFKRRSRLIGLGMGLFVCSVAPVLFIPYLPTRYTTVPLVGFLLVACGVFAELVRAAPPLRRTAALAGVVLAFAAWFGAGVLWLLGDLEDMQRLREPYAALLGEVETFAGQIPVDRPVVCVRLEAVNPLHRLHGEGSLGTPKLYFQRSVTPYGLADWAQLFTFARAGRGDEVLVDLAPADVAAGDYAVVAHVSGGFRVLEPRAASALDEIERWRQSGHVARVIGLRPPA